MQKKIRYTIFKTRWGYFGLAGGKEKLLRTCLPMTGRNDVKCRLLKGLEEVKFEKGIFRDLQGQISAYFDGSYINFDRDIPVALDGFSAFGRGVLNVCRNITYGKTMSYGEVADRIGKAGAGRAVGRVLAKNPLPLIIPCHRVICAGGGLGGFSAAGGISYKRRLLELERQCCNTP